MSGVGNMLLDPESISSLWSGFSLDNIAAVISAVSPTASLMAAHAGDLVNSIVKNAAPIIQGGQEATTTAVPNFFASVAKDVGTSVMQ